MSELSNTVIKNVLMPESVLLLNKKMIKIIGFEATYFLSFLIDKREDWSSVEGWYKTVSSEYEEDTLLSKYKQGKALSALSNIGVIDWSSDENSKSSHFRIDTYTLHRLINI